MARAYDVVYGPNCKSSISGGWNQAPRPTGRVLINSGWVVEVTNRDLIPLIHQPLWHDASYSNSGVIWLGGGALQPLNPGGSIPYDTPGD